MGTKKNCKTKVVLAWLLSQLWLAFSSPIFAQSISRDQITPQCQELLSEADLIEVTSLDGDKRQRAFLQNYFAAAFLPTPLGPLVLSGNNSAAAALEVGYIPFLSCKQRLVNFGIPKVEKNQASPVVPRLRLNLKVPFVAPLLAQVGLFFFPPLSLPFGSVFAAGGEGNIGFIAQSGLGVGLRGYFSMQQIRADITAGRKADGTPNRDWFSAATFGADVGILYSPSFKENRVFTLFASLGYGNIRSLFVVDSDLAVVSNEYPWSGVVVAAGGRLLLWKDRLEWVMEASSVVPLLVSAKFKLGYVW